MRALLDAAALVWLAILLAMVAVGAFGAAP